MARVDEYARQLAEAQERNYRRWPILGQSVNPNWFLGGSYDEEVNWMKSWIQERIAWIDSQFVAPPVLAEDVQGGNAPAKLSFAQAAGPIYYTLDGSDPRKPGGSVSSAAREFKDGFTLKPKARLVARVLAGDNWSGQTVLQRP